MALNLENLDSTTRPEMIKELDADIAVGRLYLSPRLTDSGRNDYPVLLREAIISGNDSSLAAELGTLGRLKTHEAYTTKTGTKTRKVPINAPEMLAEGEFNRFYLRALCIRAQADPELRIQVYRAKSVENPRPESEALISNTVPSASLLEDLRLNIGLDTALGLPPGPNSGLSARLVKVIAIKA
ncbi:MAG: hypothetical protein WCE73_17885 [Candidatus Angelobacter sp.]